MNKCCLRLDDLKKKTRQKQKKKKKKERKKENKINQNCLKPGLSQFLFIQQKM